MILLDGAGLLDDQLIAAVDTFDRLLNEGDEHLDRAIRALNAAAVAEIAEDEEDDG